MGRIFTHVAIDCWVGVDLYADKAARPSWFSVGQSVPLTGSATLVMVFSDYK
jgi:hypothetical protein